MQELQELPKAEKLFKDYVNNQVQQLIDQSENLAKKYLSERQSLIRKSKTQDSSRKEIQKMLRFLTKMEKIPFSLRQDLPEMQGIEDEELQQLKQKYEQILQCYPENQMQQQLEDDPKQTQLEIDTSHQTERILSGQRSPHLRWKSLLISNGLKMLQGATYLTVIMAIVYRLLF